jgi:hypothetical protein
MASSNNTSDIDTKFQTIYRYFIEKYPQDTFEIITNNFNCVIIRRSKSKRNFISLTGNKLLVSADCSAEYVLLNKITNKQLCKVIFNYAYIPDSTDSNREILNIATIINYTSKKEHQNNSNNTKGQIYQRGLGQLFLLIAIHKFLEKMYGYMLDESDNGFRRKNQPVIDSATNQESKKRLEQRVADTILYYTEKNKNFYDIPIRLHPSANAYGGVKIEKSLPEDSLVRYYESIGFSKEYKGTKLKNDTLGSQYNILIDTFLRELPQNGGFFKVKSKKTKKTYRKTKSKIKNKK